MGGFFFIGVGLGGMYKCFHMPFYPSMKTLSFSEIRNIHNSDCKVSIRLLKRINYPVKSTDADVPDDRAICLHDQF